MSDEGQTNFGGVRASGDLVLVLGACVNDQKELRGVRADLLRVVGEPGSRDFTRLCTLVCEQLHAGVVTDASGPRITVSPSCPLKAARGEWAVESLWGCQVDCIRACPWRQPEGANPQCRDYRAWLEDTLEGRERWTGVGDLPWVCVDSTGFPENVLKVLKISSAGVSTASPRRAGKLSGAALFNRYLELQQQERVYPQRPPNMRDCSYKTLVMRDARFYLGATRQQVKHNANVRFIKTDSDDDEPVLLALALTEDEESELYSKVRLLGLEQPTS